MINFVVCWEDEYWQKLELFLKRAIRRIDPTKVGSLRLFSDTVQGNGGFVRFVERDWPRYRKTGSPKLAVAFDYLICIADADRASSLNSAIGSPPAETAEWVVAAEKEWMSSLRASAGLDPERVFTGLLRWNQESVVLGAFDCSGVERKLGLKNPKAINALLAECDPSPLAEAVNFVDSFRKPTACLKQLLKAGGAPELRKNSIVLQDAEDAASLDAIASLESRVPDMFRFAATICQLASGLPQAEPVSANPEPTG